jgi:hypothetical protein
MHVHTQRGETPQAQLEFKDDRIRKFETIVNARIATGAAHARSSSSSSSSSSEMGATQGEEPVRLQVAKTCQTLEQSHAVIRVLFDMLVSTRREVRFALSILCAYVCC